MKKSILTLVAAALITSFGQAATISIGSTASLSSEITSSTTWFSSNTYILKNNVYVNNGAVLTIEAGTLIQGNPDSGLDNPGALVITRDGTLNANGTAANPITMTKLGDNKPFTSTKDNQAEQWGGLVILGETYLADSQPAATVTSREDQIEGLVPVTNTGREAGLYGGTNDDDSSGSITYVRVRYGGFELGAANEINGVTLGAVGRGTTMNNIEVFGNKDDGFEFFGGTVNTKYLVVSNIGDDSYDFDEGFRGKGQFWFTLQGEILNDVGGVEAGGYAAEMDGTEGTSGDAGHPFGIPTIYNATFVGMSKAASSSNSALNFDDNMGGRWSKSIFYDFGGSFVFIEGTPTNAATPGSTTSARRANTPYSDLVDGDLDIDGVTVNYDGAASTDAFYADVDTDTNQLEISNSIFWNADDAVTTTDFASWGEDSEGYDPGLTTSFGNDFQLTSSSPFVSYTRGTVGIAPFDTDQVTLIDPRPTTAVANYDTTSSAPVDGFFTPVTYTGAFSKSTNWAEGWTTLSEQGYFANTGTNPVDPTVVTDELLFAVTFNSVAGKDYVILASDNAGGPFTPVGFASATATSTTFIDTRALSTRQFYQVEAQ